MLKIAICDDEKYFQEQVKIYVEEYLSAKGILYEIKTFSSGLRFLNLGIELLQYSIIFLDIKMDDINGIEVAQQIRTYSSDIYIVFVTAFLNYSLDGYKVDATRYLLKGNDNFNESICECMDNIFYKMNYIVEKKEFFKEGKNIPIERIVYIESKLHKLEFHIMENDLHKYTLYATLNDLEKEIGKFHFLRIHQSFLVNLKHIKNVTGYKVVLSNNQQLIVPKARYKEVKNAFIAYKGEL